MIEAKFFNKDFYQLVIMLHKKKKNKDIFPCMKSERYKFFLYFANNKNEKLFEYYLKKGKRRTYTFFFLNTFFLE